MLWRLLIVGPRLLLRFRLLPLLQLLLLLAVLLLHLLCLLLVFLFYLLLARIVCLLVFNASMFLFLFPFQILVLSFLLLVHPVLLLLVFLIGLRIAGIRAVASRNGRQVLRMHVGRAIRASRARRARFGSGVRRPVVIHRVWRPVVFIRRPSVPLRVVASAAIWRRVVVFSSAGRYDSSTAEVACPFSRGDRGLSAICRRAQFPVFTRLLDLLALSGDRCAVTFARDSLFLR